MEKNRYSRPVVVLLLAAVSCLLWGSAAPFIKTGYRLFEIAESNTATILLFAGLRFTLAGLLVLLFRGVTTRSFPTLHKGSRLHACILGFFQTAGQYLFFYIGVANATGVHSSILTGASNLIAILFACFLFRQEKMTARKLLGCLLGFGGILLMNLDGQGGGVSFFGEGFLLFSGICSAVAAGLLRNYSRHEHPVVLCGWQFLLGGLALIAAGLVAGGRLVMWSVQGFSVLLYLGFLSAVAYSLWSILLANNPVSGVTVYGFMTPMFGVMISALMLGETAQAFRPQSLGALLLICMSIVLVNLAKSKAQ